MQLTDTHIEKYQTLCERRFGTRPSKEEAQEELIALVRTMQVAYRPLDVADYQKLESRRKELVSMSEPSHEEGSDLDANQGVHSQQQ